MDKELYNSMVERFGKERADRMIENTKAVQLRIAAARVNALGLHDTPEKYIKKCQERQAGND